MARQKRKDPKTKRLLPDNVYYREKEDRYVFTKMIQGKQYYLYDTDLTNLKEKITHLEMDLINCVNIDRGKMPLKQWFPEYVRLTKTKVKEATRFNILSYFEWYVGRYPIANMQVKKITHSQLLNHFNMLADTGLAEGTLKNVASNLFGCFELLLRDQVITVNPAYGVLDKVNFKKPKEEKTALTDEQWRTLIDFIKQDDYWIIYLPVIGLLSKSALRFGEINALTWNDIDLDRMEINIYKTMNYRKRVGQKHTFFISTPKTESSNRLVPFDDEAKQLFEMQKMYQTAMQIDSSKTVIDGYSGWVFTTKNGVPFTSEGFIAILERIRKHANAWEEERAKKQNREPVVIDKLLPHRFRRNFITHVRTELDDAELAGMVGHANEKTLARYTDYEKIINMEKLRRTTADKFKIF